MVGASCRFFVRRSAMGIQFLVQGNMVMIFFQRIMIYLLRSTCRVFWVKGFPSLSREMGFPNKQRSALLGGKMRLRWSPLAQI